MFRVSATGQHDHVCHRAGYGGPGEAPGPCTDQEHFVSGVMLGV
jgi:hypothetical protein